MEVANAPILSSGDEAVQRAILVSPMQCGLSNEYVKVNSAEIVQKEKDIDGSDDLT